MESWAVCGAPDHPRSRGEYINNRNAGLSREGSSPLSRGIRGRDRRPPPGGGIIPALAGNTSRRSWRRRACSDHPRSRGEYSTPVTSTSGGSGSSPLSRGILSGDGVAVLYRGIIPALAGNTAPAVVAAALRQDHPRSRGEYPCAFTNSLTLSGSSPLSRGIRTRPRGVAPVRRIIPALAGNTAPICGSRARITDHPRSRGEYEKGCVRYLPDEGSSPLSRGILCCCLVLCVSPRIIPALAGNTPRLPALGAGREDHPRSRGEYGGTGLRDLCGEGSSPLSRGILQQQTVQCGLFRIIPALAGNTSCWTPGNPDTRDHPRSRGEYRQDRDLAAPTQGSSPLSRGIRSQLLLAQPQRGIIPALAGNTRSSVK